MDRELDLFEEPTILPFWAYKPSEPPPDNGKSPNRPESEPEGRCEIFWAGRNHAMRRSARWAA